MDKNLKQLYSQSREKFVMSEQTSKRVKDNIFAKLGTVVIDTEEHASILETLRKLFLHSYVLAPLLVLLFISGTAYASANSLPGDALYPVKRVVETAQITLAPTQEVKTNLEEKFAQKRLDELAALQHKVDQDENANEKQDNHGPADANVNQNSNEVVRNNDKAKDKQDNYGQQRSREVKARNEVRKAIDSLKNTQQVWEHKGDKEKSQQIDQKIQNFNRQLEGDQTKNEGSGHDSNKSSHGENGNIVHSLLNKVNQE